MQWLLEIHVASVKSHHNWKTATLGQVYMQTLQLKKMCDPSTGTVAKSMSTRACNVAVNNDDS